MESHEGDLVLWTLEDVVSDHLTALQAGTGRRLLARLVMLQPRLQRGLKDGEVQLGVLSTEVLTETQQEVNLLLLDPVAPKRYKTSITANYITASYE